ncbi:D-arabinono-1,4-lactone oxidase [Flammeovirgaceae bacterium SG7u.111]|nr:D-arabinono-1,4-lactone oxidase [Flammeovirgaceae bacterium SG7u.132]WPO38287.1 D-arabinono-1,4-lactone oxidase [Flammeovirgaceae bacterium SG7u.111]
MKVRNWGGTVEFEPKDHMYPASEEDIIGMVKFAFNNGKKIRIKGSAHSWMPLFNTDEILISLDKFQGLLSVDRQNMRATAKAGTQLKLLGELLHKEGMAMENLGDIDVQSIAGALSTGTHGSGVAFGILANQLYSLVFINGRGEKVYCSEDENTELFKAAQISLGSLGVITQMTLKCLPSYKLKYVCEKETLENCLLNIKKHNSENRHFEFYWFPHTETVQTKKMNRVEEESTQNTALKNFNDLVVDNGVFWGLSEFTRVFPIVSKQTSKISAWGVSTGSYVDDSHKIFSTKRLVRFQEMEYNIPVEHVEKVIREIKELVKVKKINVHFPLECRFVKADDITISPAYKRDSAYIAVHMYKGMPYKEYFDALEPIFKKYNGRPHYGKLNNFSHDEFNKSYPLWGAFKEIRKEQDPSGIFLNTYLKNIFNEH